MNPNYERVPQNPMTSLSSHFATHIRPIHLPAAFIAAVALLAG